MEVEVNFTKECRPQWLGNRVPTAIRGAPSASLWMSGTRLGKVACVASARAAHSRGSSTCADRHRAFSDGEFVRPGQRETLAVLLYRPRIAAPLSNRAGDVGDPTNGANPTTPIHYPDIPKNLNEINTLKTQKRFQSIGTALAIQPSGFPPSTSLSQSHAQRHHQRHDPARR